MFQLFQWMRVSDDLRNIFLFHPLTGMIQTLTPIVYLNWLIETNQRYLNPNRFSTEDEAPALSRRLLETSLRSWPKKWAGEMFPIRKSSKKAKETLDNMGLWYWNPRDLQPSRVFDGKKRDGINMYKLLTQLVNLLPTNGFFPHVFPHKKWRRWTLFFPGVVCPFWPWLLYCQPMPRTVSRDCLNGKWSELSWKCKRNMKNLELSKKQTWRFHETSWNIEISWEFMRYLRFRSVQNLNSRLRRKASGCWGPVGYLQKKISSKSQKGDQNTLKWCV